MPIKSIQATQWLRNGPSGSAIEAPWLGKLDVTGSRARRIPGDFWADVALGGTGKGGKSLGKVRIAGGLASGIWAISKGAGAIRLGSAARVWTATFGGHLKSLTSYSDLGGDVTARSIGRVHARGDLSGNWTADTVGRVTVRGDIVDARFSLASPPDAKARTMGLKSLSVGGWIDGSDILSVGHLGKLTARGLRDSAVFAGIIATGDLNSDGVLDLPDQDHLIDGLAAIKALTIRGVTEAGQYVDSLINGNIAAGRLRSVSLRQVQGANGSDTQFGLAANWIGKFRYRDAAYAGSWSELTGQRDVDWPAHFDNFVVRLI